MALTGAPANGWRAANRSLPPVGQVVEVWWLVTTILAVWDGQAWRAADDKSVLRHIEYWRERRG